MDYKQVIVVRTDLGMSNGKAISQACHAAVQAALESDKRKLNEWLRQGMMKAVLRIDSLGELKAIERDAKKAKLVSAMITDAGRTELKPGTVTCLGIGPDSEEKIDKVTGKLKVL